MDTDILDEFVHIAFYGPLLIPVVNRNKAEQNRDAHHFK